ncbi:Drug/metabolite transporter [Corchorus olitorius]|uniref:WAT1-related protein n=1 Tax=Corchorus olitorius TaxID=93759 RepID=A0A1R3KRM6_9ROSI|nr:Drug/metabolite transporter [Corchorus olitorius]
MACALKATFTRYKPHLSMIQTQVGAAIVYFLTEAAFNQGLNPYVYVTYRLLIGGLIMIPFAYFLEKKSRPKLTLALFLELVFLSFLGGGLTYNLFFLSLKFTSPAFVSSVFNTVPSLTFVMAILLRMEIVNVKSPRGRAKILGTLISLAGVMVITFYKGPALKSLWEAPIHMKRQHSVHEKRVLGPILSVSSCLVVSSYFIMQAHTLKKYPAQLSLSAWINCIGGVQSAVFAVSLQHKPAAWSIRMFDISFWAILYCGISTALATFFMVWCVKVKGPVFAAMFSPLQTITVVVSAYFLLGEKLYTGSILGAVSVIIGLYVLLWGKERDQSYSNSQHQSSLPSDETIAADKTEEANLAEKEEP